MADLGPDDYRHHESPTSEHNCAVAHACGWTFDPAYNAYRDGCNFVMFPGNKPQKNNTDCWK